MRLIYGVFGYGRGHATRALSVLPALTRQHEVLVLAGGDAYASLHDSYRVLGLPRMGYVYGENGRHSLLRTLSANLDPVADALFEGSVARALRRTLESFRPQLAISDAEPWTHHLAARLGIPRVSFDHIGVLAHCRVPTPPGFAWAMTRDVSVYRLLMGRPDRVIVSSFFPAEPRHSGVCSVGPLLRPEAAELGSADAGYLLAYFNHSVPERIQAELERVRMPVVLYGSRPSGRRGMLGFRAPSNAGFLRDLSRCTAVLSTAGNQLVGECIHFKKPILVVPENCLEQEVNAAAVVRLGIGRRVSADALDAQVIDDFLLHRSAYTHALCELAKQHRPSALDALWHCLYELGGASEPLRGRRWRYA